jgi:protein ImuB
LFRTAVEATFEGSGLGVGGSGTKKKLHVKRKRFSSSFTEPRTLNSEPFHGFSGLRLTVSVHERMTDEQVRLLDGECYAGQLELDRLVERLCARLGEKSVVRPKRVESYVPERAWTEDDKVTREQGDKVVKKQMKASTSPSHPLTLSPPHRPLHLLPAPQEIRVVAEPHDDSEGRPRQFALRGGQVHRLVAAVGPERIAGEWWRGHDKTRDYYDVADESGRRFWVFRVVTRKLVKGRDGPEVRASARWFCHGVFE